MTLVVGTDEAGYGPNLGPLVVAASVWRVDADPDRAEAVLDAAVAAAVRRDGRPLWGDSKRIFRAGAGLADLELGSLVALAVAGHTVPRDWPGLAAAVAAGGLPPAAEDAALATIGLPLAAEATDVVALADEIRERFADGGVELLAVNARIVRPCRFNALLDDGLNKSDILSRTTLELAATLVAGAACPTLVWCDRHGGRQRYAGLVTRHFGGGLVRVAEETSARSAYVLPATACRVEFSVGGEARPPVALASMTAKYLRELGMRAFNACWCDASPGLAPTAGYPVDALRWRREAAAAVERKGAAWDAIWRRA